MLWSIMYRERMIGQSGSTLYLEETSRPLGKLDLVVHYSLKLVIEKVLQWKLQ